MKYLLILLSFLFVVNVSFAQTEQEAVNSTVVGHDWQFTTLGDFSGVWAGANPYTGTITPSGSNLTVITANTLSNIADGDIVICTNGGIYEITVTTPGASPVVSMQLINDPINLGFALAPSGSRGYIGRPNAEGILPTNVIDGGAGGGLGDVFTNLIATYNSSQTSVRIEKVGLETVTEAAHTKTAGQVVQYEAGVWSLASQITVASTGKVGNLGLIVSTTTNTFDVATADGVYDVGSALFTDNDTYYLAATAGNMITVLGSLPDEDIHFLGTGVGTNSILWSPHNVIKGVTKLTTTVSQTAHGFTAGALLSSNGADYDTASVENFAANGKGAIGFVASVTDANTYELASVANSYVDFGVAHSIAVDSFAHLGAGGMVQGLPNNDTTQIVFLSKTATAGFIFPDEVFLGTQGGTAAGDVTKAELISVVTGQGASLISIEDAGGNYVPTNLEVVLDTIFEKSVLSTSRLGDTMRLTLNNGVDLDVHMSDIKLSNVAAAGVPTLYKVWIDTTLNTFNYSDDGAWTTLADGSNRLYRAATYTNITALTFPTLAVGDRIKVEDTGTEYLISATTLAGYNGGLADELAVITVGANFAILQPNEGFVDIRNFGAIADGATDNVTALTKTLEYSKVTQAGVKVVNYSGLPYSTTSLTTIVDWDLEIVGVGNPTILTANTQELIFEGLNVLSTTVADSVQSRSSVYRLASTTGVEIGDMLSVDGRLIAETGWKYRFTEIHEVQDISGTTITNSTANYFSFNKENKWKSRGNGTLTQFFYPLYYVPLADIEVYVNGTLQTLNTDYTVVSVSDGFVNSASGDSQGVDITFTTAPLNGDLILMQLNTDQPVEIYRSGKLTIEGVTFQKNDGGYCLELKHLNGATIRDVDFLGVGQNSTDGLKMQFCANTFVENLNFKDIKYCLHDITSRNSHSVNVHGNTVRHVATTALFSANTVYENLSATNATSIFDAHPSFDMFIRNTNISSGGGLNYRGLGLTAENINVINTVISTDDDGSAVNWFKSGAEYGFTRQDNVGGYPFALNLDNVKYSENSTAPFTVSQTKEVNITNSAFYGLKLENAGYTNTSNRTSDLIINIDNSKIDLLDLRAADIVRVSNSVLGSVSTGAYLRGTLYFDNTILGIDRNYERTEHVFTRDYSGNTTIIERALRYFNNCVIANHGTFFSNTDGSLAGTAKYIFNGSTFNSTNPRLSINTSFTSNTDYLIEGLETCHFLNSYASILNIDITNGGSGYSASTSISISAPDFGSFNYFGLFPTLPSLGDVKLYQGPNTANFYYKTFDTGDNLLFNAPVQATAIPVITGGVITDVIITNSGIGYVNPTMVITAVDGTGTGAVLTTDNVDPELRTPFQQSVTGADADNYIEWGVENIGGTFVWSDGTYLRHNPTMPATITDGIAIISGVLTGTGVPATVPTAIGQIYVDTTGGTGAQVIYMAAGTSASTDWIQTSN